MAKEQNVNRKFCVLDTSELIMDNTNVTRKEGSFLSKIFNVFFE